MSEEGSTPPDIHRMAPGFLRTFRALRRLGLIDLRAHLSARLPGGHLLVTPAPGVPVPPPAWLSAEDLLRVDPAKGAIAGRWKAPPDMALHLAIYAARPDVGAILYAQPPTILAFMATGRDLLPLTHVESDLVLQPLPSFGRGELIVREEEAQGAARALGSGPALLLPGQGVALVGATVAEAAARCYQLELLARVNATAIPLGPPARVGQADAARVAAQRAPADDYRAYFDAVAGPDPPAVSGTGPVAITDEPQARRQVALACRLLYQRGLVEHLEHVSHRLPDGAGFLISPRKHLGKLQPEDLATVDMEGRWVAGPVAPPPFLWLHRDMFAARPEVHAIVHTHQLFARAYAIAGRPVPPLYRGGARWLREPAPIYPVPDLIFDEEHRRGTLAALGEASLVHERAHGTDFLAATIEEATVAAIQYEDSARLHHVASALGEPQPLGRDILDRLEMEEPEPAAWWRDYVADLDAV